MSRYSTNIRRIAQTEELSDRVRQAEQQLIILAKADIPGARAIAYPDGGPAQTGSPGGTNPDKSGAPDVKSPTDKNALDKAGKDNNSTDGDALLNGSKVLQKGDDPGAIGLKDCDSGEKIDMRLNVGANEGETKFKHPEGWLIDGPPSSSGWEGFVVGTYYSGSGTYTTGTVYAAVPQRLPYEAIGFTTGLYSATDVRNITIASPTRVNFEIYLTWNPPLEANNGWNTTSINYSSANCGMEIGTERCPTSVPDAYTNWQQQDPTYKHQLSFSASDGGFVSSQYDDGLPAKFRNNAGSGVGLNNVRLCTEAGNEVVMSALSDGSFAFFQEDGFGYPKEKAKIFHFDKEGKYSDIMKPEQYNYLKSTNVPVG